MAAVDYAGDSRRPTSSPPSQPPASAGRPAQSAQAGAVSFQSFLGSPRRRRRAGFGWARSQCPQTRAEKKPQKSKTPSLCEMRLQVNTEAWQAD